MAPGTANGQILYWNGTAWVTLAPGANGTNLKLNNGLPVWENSVGSIPSGTLTGQLLYWNGTAWVTLAPGTDGKILRWANGSPTWDSTVPNIVLNEYVFYFNSDKNNRLRLILRPKLIDDGGERIIEKGIYYSQTNSTPTENDLNSTIKYTSNEELSNPFDEVDYNMDLDREMIPTENLIPGAQYYIRAYAINSKGKGYSDVIRLTAPLQPDIPVLSTPIISNITQYGATATFKIQQQIKEQNSNIIQGFVWDTNPNPTTALSSKTTNLSNYGYFQAFIEGGNVSTTYYVRAFYTDQINTIYSPQVTFTTLPPSMPTVSRLSLTTVTASTGSVYFYDAFDGGARITERGFVWSTNPNPTTALNTKLSGAQAIYSATISGLVPATTYYVRAFATNTIGTSYSNEIVFTTLPLSAPVFSNNYSTTNISSITGNSASASILIQDNGGSAITQKGFVWSTSPNPTTALTTKIIDATSSNIYVGITGLSPSTTYYVRAFATNAIGTSYSNEIVFTTLALSVPSMTVNPSNIRQTYAELYVSNISDGGSTITSRGIVWSSSPNPTVSLTTKSIDTSSGNYFYSYITGLLPATTYYARAFATNAMGTGYSPQSTFTTLALAAPSISSLSASSITQTGLSASSFISNDGGSTITQKGFVWSTSPNPTTALTTKSISTTSDNSISSSITGLSPATTYYLRAFATNSQGTSYSLETTFTTSP
jgi:hypothetical protein